MMKEASVTFLTQARNPRVDLLGGYWLDASALGLSTIQAVEWNLFTDGMRNLGIRLVQSEDELVWAWIKVRAILQLKKCIRRLFLLVLWYRRITGFTIFGTSRCPQK